MPLSRIQCVCLSGLEALPVEVEVNTANSDKLNLVIVGLADTAVRESKDRVLTAIKNSNFNISTSYIIVNLAPGDLKKEGAIYDLPMAIGLLSSSGLLKSDSYKDYLIVGELGLSGQLRPIAGALAFALLAKQLGKKGILLPINNAIEASMVPGLQTYGISTLRQAVNFLENPTTLEPIVSKIDDSIFKGTAGSIDFSDIKGQAHAKRALEIAAAGAHNIVLSGPPGCGKSMMAKALVGIMPELTLEESLEVTRIHSVAGLLPEGKHLVIERPFRSPHHTISYAGLIGGGSIPRPGEVSLAHGGILFLDEFPEFSKTVLEVLRQPLEDRQVTISRATGSFTFPSRFICIAAMNPCPCGYLGHPDKVCKDTELQVNRYRGKISGPLWDRLDLHIDVPPVRYQEMISESVHESSGTIRERVKQAREKQTQRLGIARTNAVMTPQELKKHCQLAPSNLTLWQQAVENVGLSARGANRVLRVARTIADLENSPSIESDHLLEAINYRTSR